MTPETTRPARTEEKPLTSEASRVSAPTDAAAIPASCDGIRARTTCAHCLCRVWEDETRVFAGTTLCLDGKTCARRRGALDKYLGARDATRDPNAGHATGRGAQRDGAAPVRAFLKPDLSPEIEEALGKIPCADREIQGGTCEPRFPDAEWNWCDACLARAALRSAILSALDTMQQAMWEARDDRDAARNTATFLASRERDLREALAAFPVFQIGQLRHLYANAERGHYDPHLLSHAISALEAWNDRARAVLSGDREAERNEGSGVGLGGHEAGPISAHHTKGEGER